MFSDEGRTLDEETLEYAWLLEIQLGKLGGKVTAPQVRLLNGCEPVPADQSGTGSHPSFTTHMLNP